MNKTKLTKDFDETNPAFLLHFKNLKYKFGHVICVNLLKKNKKSE